MPSRPCNKVSGQASDTRRTSCDPSVFDIEGGRKVGCRTTLRANRAVETCECSRRLFDHETIGTALFFLDLPGKLLCFIASPDYRRVQRAKGEGIGAERQKTRGGSKDRYQGVCCRHSSRQADVDNATSSVFSLGPTGPFPTKWRFLGRLWTNVRRLSL